MMAVLPLPTLLTLLHHLASAASGDPQTRLLNEGCSQYNATDPAAFASSLNATLDDILSQLAGNASHSPFATAQSLRGPDPVYALFQCRDYLSHSDCAACFANASARIRRCAAANGARVVYDGCFLRYETSGFFDQQATLPGNVALCGNNSAAGGTGFAANADALVVDLTTAVPKTDHFFAAAMAGTGPGTAYGVAQCVRTVSAESCAECLQVAYGNIKGCFPDADARAVDAGCFMRYSSSAFFPTNQTVDLAPFLGSGSSDSNKKAIIGGVVGGVGGLLIIVGLLSLLWIRRSRREGGGTRGDILGATELQGPMKFHYKDLKVATRNFDESNKLGEGGFGDVYKGILKHGNAVAIKRLSIGRSSRMMADFQSEVKLISNVHHRNLLRLLGCSSKGLDLLLVYEYMANSSLDKFLFGEQHGSLNWKQRFNIILGMARGLAYLHDEFHVRVIHRDIKPSNVLLDEDFQPKIADFGLVRLLPEDKSHMTTKFAGTLGYIAPEYAIHGQLSEKVDTYSFGIVVLEIVSGRKATDITLEPVTQYLLQWGWKLYDEGKLMDLVDVSMGGDEYTAEEMTRVIEIALLCTQPVVADRPSMPEVVVMLVSKHRPDVQPKQPVFVDPRARIQEGIYTSTSSAHEFLSQATYSISEISSR